MQFTMLPIIFLAQLIAIAYAAHLARRRGFITRGGQNLITTLLVLQVLWAVTSALLALKGTYLQAWFLAAWPPFWVTFIAVLLVMLPWLLFAGVRDTLRGLVDAVPLHWLVGFQGLRILAIGGVVKALNGEFARYFGLYIGIPDLLFGLSALVMARLVYRGRVGSGTVVVWNLIGAMIIVPAGLILLQMGLPGAWQVFTDTPTIATIFEFPMALAPTLVVPMFVMMNLFVALRLVERYGSAKTEAGDFQAPNLDRPWKHRQAA